jgi:two-component system OmpR family response regulator
MRVLIVEDDAATRDLLERGLREELFDVEAVSDAASAEARAAADVFDAIVLDVILPGHDGFMVCRRLRARGLDTPILLLTGRHDVEDRIRGLDAGADDYLLKPFAIRELLARLRAVMRRGRTKHRDAVLNCGPIALDQRDQVVTVDGAAVMLTPTEYRLLQHLMVRAGALVTRAELSRHVWGDAEGMDSNTIDVYISHLRKKLGASSVPMLRTVRGVGYRLQGGQP